MKQPIRRAFIVRLWRSQNDNTVRGSLEIAATNEIFYFASLTELNGLMEKNADASNMRIHERQTSIQEQCNETNAQEIKTRLTPKPKISKKSKEKQKMQNSAFQSRIERLFKMYDANHDGSWTLQDFTDHVDKLAVLRGQPPDAPAYQALRQTLEAWWEQMRAVDNDNDGRLSQAEVYAFADGLISMAQQAVASDAPWPLTPWIDSLYGVIDANSDQRITLQEYRDWLDATGISADMDVESAFRGFDKNHDDSLSRDEFIKVSRQFWTNPSPQTPGARWIGP